MTRFKWIHLGSGDFRRSIAGHLKISLTRPPDRGKTLRCFWRLNELLNYEERFFPTYVELWCDVLLLITDEMEHSSILFFRFYLAAYSVYHYSKFIMHLIIYFLKWDHYIYICLMFFFFILLVENLSVLLFPCTIPILDRNFVIIYSYSCCSKPIWMCFYHRRCYTYIHTCIHTNRDCTMKLKPWPI